MNIFLHTLPEKILYFCSALLSKVLNGNKDLASIRFNNILCVKLDEIGDLCYSLHVYEMLKKQFPAATVTLLCRPFAVSLVSHAPYPDKVVSDAAELTGDYDLIIDLRGNWSSLRYALKVWPKARLDRGTVRWANRKLGKHPHEVITNLQVVQPLISKEHQTTEPKIHTGAEDMLKAQRFLQSHGISRFALLHTGAKRVLRRWDKFDLLASYLKKQKNLDIIFTGDAGDEPAIKSLQGAIPFITYSTAGSFSLAEFAALATKASLYIGNESGPLHIAAVAGAPVIGLYGPGEPFVFYPWGRKAVYVHHVLECNPCDQVHCVHPDNPCINRIMVDEVTENVDKLLQE